VESAAAFVLKETAGETPAGGSGASRGSRRRRGSRSRKRVPENQGERTPELNGAAHDSEPTGSFHSGQEEKPTEEKVSSPSPGSVAEIPQKGESHGADKAAMEKPESINEKKGKKGGDSDRRTPSVFRTRRSRMVHLKTGGRRRFIKKAPAQKIREIN
jgi:cell division protease FtsH